MLVEYRKPQFIYPKGKIRFLELDDVIEKVQLKSGSMLVLIGINALCWDSKNMQAGVKLEANEMRACRTENGDRNH